MKPPSIASDGQPVRPAWTLAVLAAVATAVAGYLAWVAWQQHGLPVGCGENGGCAEVLTSRWSSLGGLPVGALALPLYVCVAGLALRPQSRLGVWGLAFAVGALVSAAAWFLFLQAAILRAFCPWCVGEHVLGLMMAGLALRQVRRRSGSDWLRNLSSGGLLGAVSVLGLAGLQMTLPGPQTTVRLPSPSSSAAPPEDGQESLLQGHLRVTPSEEPCLGDPAAAHRLYLMFDYCCPHCRRTHEYLLDALALYPQQFSLICLPMPRDADCNPAIVETEARFEHACELAQLALAVWWAKPERFAEFDRWLFESAQPRLPVDARAKAEALVSPERLERVEQQGEVQRRIARNVQAYNDSQLAYLPVMMSVGMDTIVGRPEDRDALLKIITEDLFSTTLD